MRPKIADGIPELLIPPCEPLQIPEIRIKQNSGAIRMESVYSDINVTGLSNFTLRRCMVDMEKNRIVVDFWFPSLEMTAKYNLHGKVKMLDGQKQINKIPLFFQFSHSFSSFIEFRSDSPDAIDRKWNNQRKFQ